MKGRDGMDNRIDRIKTRLESTIPYITPGEWYHEDIPYLISKLDRLTSENEKAWNQLHVEIEKEQKIAAERDELLDIASSSLMGRQRTCKHYIRCYEKAYCSFCGAKWRISRRINMDDIKQIGASIKRYRETKGITLREADRDLGTYPSNIHRYEHGLVTPSLPILWILADYYHVSLDELVGRKFE